MNIKQRDEMVSSLRQLADFIEEKGEDLPYLNVSIGAYEYGDYDETTYKHLPDTIKAKMAGYARALKPCKKDFSGQSFALTRKFGILTVRIAAEREKVCRKIVTGTKVVPAYTIPERIEEEAEWVCDEPLLAIADALES